MAWPFALFMNLCFRFRTKQYEGIVGIDQVCAKHNRLNWTRSLVDRAQDDKRSIKSSGANLIQVKLSQTELEAPLQLLSQLLQFYKQEIVIRFQF